MMLLNRIHRSETRGEHHHTLSGKPKQMQRKK